ncbi:MAG: amino acid adenylation domain-containing protein, partial [Saprospiraceae bacterium]
VLSFEQERLWFTDQLEGSTQYHLPFVQLFSSDLNRKYLAESFQEIVERHEVLRTVFYEAAGTVYQNILSADTWELSYEEIQTRSKDELQAIVDATIAKAYDLSKDHPLRVKLLRLPSGAYLMILVLHHIAADGWSSPILLKELVSLYRSKEREISVELVPIEIQYADYAAWQRRYFKDRILASELAYWSKQLSGLEALALSTDYARPAVQSFGGAQFQLRITAAIAAGITDLATKVGASNYMFLLAAFKVLLYKYTGQSDFAVGSPIANRTQAEVKNLIGFFVNTLALRTEINPALPFLDFVKTVKSTALAAYEHQTVPFDKVVEQVVTQRDRSRSPLFQVMFAYETDLGILDLDLSQALLGEAKPSSPELEVHLQRSKFDLSFTLGEQSEDKSWLLTIDYATDLWLPATVQRMAQHFQKLLTEIIALPTQKLIDIELLDATEKKILKVDFNQTRQAYPDKISLVELFEQAAKAHPQRTALSLGTASLSYESLEARANQLAHYLLSIGTKKEMLVCLALDRSFEMIIAMLATMKAGAAYVPIEPDLPAARIQYLLEDTESKLVLTTKKYQTVFSSHENIKVVYLEELELDAHFPTSALAEKPAIDHLAYLIYTSGSTGKPKGVMVEHGSVVNELCAFAKIFEVDIDDKHLLLASYVFDASVEQIFVPLTNGAQVVLLSKTDLLDGTRLAEIISTQNITHVNCTPSLLQTIAVKAYPALKRVCAGGEFCPVSLAEAWSPYVRFFNEYGPTETTITALYYCHDGSAQPISGALPIGKPIANTQAYILDAQQKIVPIGVVGELYIGGKGLTRGYWNRPSLTAEKFVTSPFDATEKLYRTGDLACWLADGVVEFKGRIDDQVKVRGYRIELGEIETVLLESPLVEKAVVLVKKNSLGHPMLVTYFIPTQAATAAPEASLRKYLQTHLPDYMVPSSFVSLAAFPLTATGKLDKKYLSNLEVLIDQGQNYVAPRNAVEEALTQIWRKILKLEQLSVQADFFEMGGHSLLVTKLIAAIRDALHVNISIKEVFERPTIEQLATYILSLKNTDASESLVEAKEEARNTFLPVLTGKERPTEIPASFSQERLWLIDQMGGSTHYHIPFVQYFWEAIDYDILEEAFQRIINRHEVLRTVFYEVAGTVYQKVLPEDTWEMRQPSTPKPLSPATMQPLLEAEVQEAFDLTKDHPIRVSVRKLSAERSVLVVVLHHIATDAWSSAIFLTELQALYQRIKEKRPTELADLSIQYADYALWERRNYEAGFLTPQLSYWKNQLAGLEALVLPTDFARPAKQSFAGAVHRFTIEKELAIALDQLARKTGSTKFMLLLAIFKIVLYKYTGQVDIGVGIPIANRTQASVARLIGFFVNTLVIRSRLDPTENFETLLNAVKATSLAAFDHQEIPFEKVVTSLVKERDQSQMPLFQVFFSYEKRATEKKAALRFNEDVFPAGRDEKAWEQYFEQLTTADIAKFDLSLAIEEIETALYFSFEYCTDLFLPATIIRLEKHFINVLSAVTLAPNTRLDQVAMLEVAEENTIVETFGKRPFDYPKTATLVSLFEAQVKKNPTGIALEWEGVTLSYQELDDRANELTAFLRSNNVQSEDLVCICLARSIEMIVSVFAVLKAGAAYVPIDPNFPSERINYLLEDTQSNLVLTIQPYKSYFKNAAKVICLDDKNTKEITKVELPKVVVQPGNLAYVMYTSGSTGLPKGVQIEHGALVNELWYLHQFFGLETQERVLQTGNFVFDLSVEQIFTALLFGGTLVLPKQEDLLHQGKLVRFLEKAKITHLHATPSFLENLPARSYPALKVVMSGGEACSVALAKAWAPYVKFFNMYGPTETCIIATGYQFDPEHLNASGKMPIGKPVGNFELFIVDQSMQVVPVGVPGELYIGGKGLARAYWNRPKLTQEKFINSPFR